MSTDQLPSGLVPGYVECALWSSTDDDGDPLDSGERELSPETRADMEGDCRDFFDANEADLAIYVKTFDYAHAGHDFWLTRNGHGAGFWDRTYAEGELRDACMRLSEASKVYGTVDLYVGDDGLIYA